MLKQTLTCLKVLPAFGVFLIKTLKMDNEEFTQASLQEGIKGEGSEEPVRDVTLAMFGNCCHPLA